MLSFIGLAFDAIMPNASSISIYESFSTCTAQTLYSGMRANSSSAAFVILFTGESGKWKGIHVSPSDTFLPTRAVAVIASLLLRTCTRSPFDIPVGIPVV